jgi:hypothetical protein
MPIILATWETEIGRITVRSQPGRKNKSFARRHLNRESWVWWHVPVIPAMAGSIR